MADKLMLQSNLPTELIKYREKLLNIVPTELSLDFPGFLRFFGHHDEAYVISDLKSNQITWTLGIEKWLGYLEGEKTPLRIDFMSQYVHPFLRDWYQIINDAATLVLAGHPTKFLKSRFVLSVPMKKRDNKYVLVKQMSMPFEYDEEGKVGKFLTSFTLFDQYRGEPMSLELFETTKKALCRLIFRDSKISPRLYKSQDGHRI